MENYIAKERPSLSITRRYNAAPEKVWYAWTDPQALTHWFGPEESNAVLLAETDVRVGGRYHIIFQSPGSEAHDVSGIYREVVEHRKLVFTWAWKSTPERESIITLSLMPCEQGTELILLQEQLFDEAARAGHEYGWNGALKKLAGFLAN